MSHYTSIPILLFPYNSFSLQLQQDFTFVCSHSVSSLNPPKLTYPQPFLNPANQMLSMQARLGHDELNRRNMSLASTSRGLSKSSGGSGITPASVSQLSSSQMLYTPTPLSIFNLGTHTPSHPPLNPFSAGNDTRTFSTAIPSPNCSSPQQRSRRYSNGTFWCYPK